MSKFYMPILGLAACLVLLGQGCAVGQRTDVMAPKPSLDTEAGVDAEVDAAVDAILEEEEAAAEAETESSAEVEAFDNNKADLDAYSNLEYEME